MSRLLRGYAACRYGQMHYIEGRPNAGSPASEPTLVMLHQNPSAAMEYEPLIREMARDRRVIAFDTPGYGMSDPPPKPLSMAAYAASFSDAIDDMELAANGPLDVFGFHTGSLLGVELGLLRPDVVGRLVLSGLPMRSPEERAERLAAARATPGPTEDGAGILENSARLWRYVVTNRTPGVPLERAVAVFAEKNRTLHRGWWAYDGVWSYDYARLTGIVQPTLILQPHDMVLDASRAAGALIPGSQFVDLPSLDRDVFDVDAPQIAEAMRRFLNRAAPAALDVAS